MDRSSCQHSSSSSNKIKGIEKEERRGQERKGEERRGEERRGGR